MVAVIFIFGDECTSSHQLDEDPQKTKTYFHILMDAKDYFQFLKNKQACLNSMQENNGRSYNVLENYKNFDIAPQGIEISKKTMSQCMKLKKADEIRAFFKKLLRRRNRKMAEGLKFNPELT